MADCLESTCTGHAVYRRSCGLYLRMGSWGRGNRTDDDIQHYYIVSAGREGTEGTEGI